MVEKYLRTNKTDADLIHNIIASHTIVDYALVTRVWDDSVDVKLINKRFGKEVQLTKVELLTVGSSAYSVEITPVVGDLVLLLGSRSYIDKLADITATQDKVSRLSYDLANVKAIQIAPPKESKVVIKIDPDGNITLTTAGNINVSSSGKTSIDSTGDISINGDGKVVVGATSGLEMGGGIGLVALGNDVKSLYSWLSGLLTDLQGIITIGAPPTHTLSPVTIAALTARAAELATFLK